MRKYLLAAFMVTVLSICGVAAAKHGVAFADAKADVCAGLGATGGSCTPVPGETTVEGTLATVIKIISWVVGIISVVMVMVGGFQYVTSGGDSAKVTSAKNTIMYALIGIVIVALSQIMVNFVIEKFV